MDPTVRRLMQELEDVSHYPETGIHIIPNIEGLYTWFVGIQGPAGSLYEGGIFPVKVKFDNTYPYGAPTIKFCCPIFHVNVFHNGKVCADFLEDKWDSKYSMLAVLLSVQTLLAEPNHESPANILAGDVFLDDLDEYNRRILACVSVCTDRYRHMEAHGPPPALLLGL